MHVLFVHPDYPAQFRLVAFRLAADFGWDCTFATNNTKTPDLQGVRRVIYRPTCGSTRVTPEPMRAFYNAYGHARGVYDALKKLVDVRPDLVVAHSGFGSSLFLPYLYDAPVVNFFEYFYRPVGQDLGYRAETPVTEDHLLCSRTRNAMIALDLDNCDRGWCPNEYQRGLMPAEYLGKIEVIPEGIDTELWRRDCGAQRRLPDGTVIPAGTKVVTYVSRGFELMRGFDIFMKAAKRIYQQFPDVVFVVVGTDRVCYGGEQQLIAEKSFRQYVLKSGDYDLSRFHFTGRVPEEALARILSQSDLHIYLTVPFVTSWSLLNAMSCGCVVLASDQACVREYITHERNGLLCDFFDAKGIAEQAAEVLKNPAQYRVLGTAARLTIEEEYSLDVSLPKIKRFFEEVASKKREPTVRAEALVRPGTLSSKKRRGDVQPGLTADLLARSTGFQPPDKRNHDHNYGLKSRVTKTILFTWELGGGLGHMMQMLPLAEALVRRGHSVIVALRQLERAASVFGRAGVSFLGAPAWNPVAGARRIRKLETFTQLLVNVGFGDEGELSARACAWRNLFRMAKPDVVVFDHSPTALLGSRGQPMRRVLIGSGFCCPPDDGSERPWGMFRRAVTPEDAARLMAIEANVLGRMNRVLGRWKQPPMERLGQLFDVQENLLTTFPELEQWSSRGRTADKPVRYWGTVLPQGGDAPMWPEAHGPKIFAYVKRFDGLPELMGVLKAKGLPTIVYLDGPATGLEQFESATLRVQRQRLDLRRVGSECDVAVLHAGQGATAAMLLAGKPILQIPLVLEQRLTALATARLGASGTAPASAGKADEVARQLGAVLTEPRYAEAARRFAKKYSDFDLANQVERMVGRVEELIQTKRPGDRETRGHGEGEPKARGKVFAG